MTDTEEARRLLLAEQRCLPPALHRSPHARRSPQAPGRQAPPHRRRTARRSAFEEGEAPSQGPDGGDRAAPPGARQTRCRPRSPRRSRRRRRRPRRRRPPDARRPGNGTIPLMFGFDRAGWPFLLGAVVLALAGAGYRRPLVGAARRGPGPDVPVLLPRSRAAAAGRPGAHRVAGRRSRDGGGPGRRRRAARHLAADHDLPVAARRAREPGAGLGPRHARSRTRPGSSCRPTSRRAAR